MNKVILVTQDDKHNKFWSAEAKSKELKVRWGRIGNKGQEASYPHPDPKSLLNRKRRSKERKGYEKISKSKFKELTVIATIVGTANKMQHKWVEIKGRKILDVSDLRLQQPDCEPGLLVEMQSRKLGDIKIIVSVKGCIEYPSQKKIDDSHKWWELAQKAHEAIASVT